MEDVAFKLITIILPANGATVLTSRVLPEKSV